MSMENDLISRSAVMDAIRDAEFQHWHPLDEIENVIAAVPTVDAVPVVRCKDCKYRFCNSGHEKPGCPECPPWFEDDDFCSGGKRMSEGGTK